MGPRQPQKPATTRSPANRSSRPRRRTADLPDKRLPKKTLVDIPFLVRALAERSRLPLPEAHDILLEVTSSKSARAIKCTLYDTQWAGLAEPAPDRLFRDALMDMYNETWWASEQGVDTRWQIRRESASKLFASSMVHLGLEIPKLDPFAGNAEAALTPSEAREQEILTTWFERVSELLELIRQKETDEPRSIQKLICHAVLEPDSEDANVIVLFQRHAERLRSRKDQHQEAKERHLRLYGDRARLFLDHFSFKERKPNEQDLAPGEYLSLRTWMIESGYLGSGMHPFQLGRHFERPRSLLTAQPPDLIGDFFRASEGDFQSAQLMACELIYGGIPIYRRADEDSNRYDQVSYQDEDYIYLSKMGQFGVPDTYSLPYWATEFFVRRDHLAAHKVFFSQAGSLTPEEVRTLRNALRAHIGCQVPTESCEAEKIGGSLLQIALRLARREVDELFRGTASKDWPKKDAVIKWLMSNVPELRSSKKRAEAVDVIAAPDGARPTR